MSIMYIYTSLCAKIFNLKKRRRSRRRSKRRNSAHFNFLYGQAVRHRKHSVNSF